jgi:hypothetical protein
MKERLPGPLRQIPEVLLKTKDAIFKPLTYLNRLKDIDLPYPRMIATTTLLSIPSYVTDHKMWAYSILIVGGLAIWKLNRQSRG